MVYHDGTVLYRQLLLYHKVPLYHMVCDRCKSRRPTAADDDDDDDDTSQTSFIFLQVKKINDFSKNRVVRTQASISKWHLHFHFDSEWGNLTGN